MGLVLRLRTLNSEMGKDCLFLDTVFSLRVVLELFLARPWRGECSNIDLLSWLLGFLAFLALWLLGFLASSICGSVVSLSVLS